MIKFVCGFLALALAVLENTDGACSKEWIKYMVVNVCEYAMKRRPAENDWPIYISIVSRQDVDQRFRQMICGGSSRRQDQEQFEFEWLMEEFIRSMNEPGRNRTRARREVGTNNDYANAGDLLGVPREWLAGDDTLESSRSGPTFKRHIIDLIKKCCSRICTVEDFKGACA